MAEKSGRGWQALLERSRDKVEELRGDMAQVGQYVGLDISEFRRIVNQVQKGEKEARQAKKEMVEANLRLVIIHRQEIHKPRAAVSRPHPGRATSA